MIDLIKYYIIIVCVRDVFRLCRVSSCLSLVRYIYYSMDIFRLFDGMIFEWNFSLFGDFFI